MKRHVLIVFLAALALTTCVAGKAAALPASDTICAAYARLDAAFDRRDVPGVLALYAPDFVRHDVSGVQNLAQTRQRLMDDFEGTKSVSVTTRIKSLAVHGNREEAIVRRRVDVTLLTPLPDLPPPYFKVEVNQETWGKTPNGWHLKAMQETPLQRLLRGLDARDQTIRREIIADPKNPVLAARMTAVDAADRA